MGAYENAMHEEGTCEDFAREIIRMVNEMVIQKNRTALLSMFCACAKIENGKLKFEIIPAKP